MADDRTRSVKISGVKIRMVQDKRRRLFKPRMNFGAFPATFPGMFDDCDFLAARRRAPRPNPFQDEV